MTRVTLALLLTPLLAAADTTATLTMTGSSPGVARGFVLMSRMYQQGHFIRQELIGPMHRVTLVDGVKKSLVMLDETTKTYTEADLRKNGGRDLTGADTAACAEKADVVKCLVLLGFKKVGEEKVNGYDCEVFERAAGAQHSGTSKLWHPKALKSVPFVRLTLAAPTGGGQLDLSEIREEKLDAALFRIPDGYKKRGPAEKPATPPARAVPKPAGK